MRWTNAALRARFGPRGALAVVGVDSFLPPLEHPATRTATVRHVQVERAFSVSQARREAVMERVSFSNHDDVGLARNAPFDTGSHRVLSASISTCCVPWANVTRTYSALGMWVPRS